MNCLSLLRNFDELCTIQERLSIDLLTLSETHIDDLIDDSELKVDGYDIVRKDRNRRGGGVAAYIRSNLKYNIRTDIMSDELELIAIKLKVSHRKPIMILVWYRPPNANVDVFQQFERVIQSIDDHESDLLILGDLNCDVASYTRSWQTKHLFDIIENYDMEQIINSPTRVTSRTSSTIDVIITNRPEKITNSGVIPISL